jgi:hypothetical protein
MGERTTPTCAFRVDAALVELLDERLGPPLDSYVMGWQVWLEDNGPGGITLEWRLHPPAGFRMPRGVNPHDLFDVVLQGLAEVEDPERDAFATGRERHTLAEVWEALEVFPAYDDPTDPAALAAAAAAALGGRHADTAGRVDHGRLGDLWKGARSRGGFSVGQVLLGELPPAPKGDGGG